MCIDVHLQNGDVSVYWMLLLLDISDVSVVIAICGMPRQEFLLRERMYIHNTYMKSRKSCSETRCKFWIKFPGRPVPNPSTIRRQAKRFKERGSVKNRNANHRRHAVAYPEIGSKGGQNIFDTRGVHKVSFPLVPQLLIHLLHEATACTW